VQEDQHALGCGQGAGHQGLRRYTIADARTRPVSLGGGNMCGDPDTITHSVYADLAWDCYSGNPKLRAGACERYEDVSAWR
jgi:hypothetical protein